MRAPDLFEEVVGYRAFEVDTSKLLLRGKFVPVLWSPGPNTARCEAERLDWWQPTVAGEHTSPDCDCACGFHAYHDLDKLLSRVHGGLVFGAVSCWGKIVPYADGFRAQHARVAALADPLDRGRSTALAEKYGVPLFQRVDDLETVDAGQSLPRNLR